MSGPPTCEGIGGLIGAALLGDAIASVGVVGIASVAPAVVEVLGFRPLFFFSIGPDEGVVAVVALVVGVEVEGREAIEANCTGA